MSAIGPGDWVECFKSINPNSSRVGHIFKCDAVWPTTVCELDHGPCGGLTIVGDPAPSPTGWAVCCFRPIYREDADLIEQLKQPAPEIERELTDA